MMECDLNRHRVLKKLGQKYQREGWSNALDLFVKSGELIVRLSEKAVNYDGNACSELLERIANTEEEAYKFLA